jgi:hypothetical protein
MALASSTRSEPARVVGRSPSRLRERAERLDPVEVLILLAFGILSVWIILVLLAKQGPNQVWTGTDGPYIGDQMQYVGWIRDAAQHLLISNPFQTRPTPHDYLHPGLAISGGFVRLGMTASVAYLIWKPIAVLALFTAARKYVHRLLQGVAQRRIALVIALFYVSPLALLADLSHWNQLLPLQAMGFEMWPGLYLWGYPFTAISVAALVWTLLAHERDRGSPRPRPWAPCLGLLCAWLQPWQGATVLAILLGSEGVLWLRGHRGRLAPLAVTATATAAPLVYYAVLDRLDESWALSARANLVQTWSTWPLLLALAPLGVVAALSYRRRPRSFQEVAIRTWPLASLGIFWLIEYARVGTYPLHALQGLSIPFAVLAVTGASTLRTGLRPGMKAVAAGMIVTALVVPSAARELNDARSLGAPSLFASDPYLISTSEQRALGYLDHSRTGGPVLSTAYLGQIVPAETGRRTWVGIYSWTPAYSERTIVAEALFSRRLSPASATRLVRSSRARFMLQSCSEHANLTSYLGSLLESTRHFGCAKVYELRPTS